MRVPIVLMALIVFNACQQNKTTDTAHQDTAVTIKPAVSNKNQKPALHTDTLQYIHFEGNYDYWYAVFINSRKDTVQLVVDDQLPAKYRNRLLAVTWFTDTLFEAGDNDAKYAGKRIKAVRPLSGSPFLTPPTAQRVIKDVENLPEVRSNADQTGIAERPTDDKEYYLVETGTHEEDKFSRLFMFRVYVYPKYEIRYYDPGKDVDISLEEWRRTRQ